MNFNNYHKWSTEKIIYLKCKFKFFCAILNIIEVVLGAFTGQVWKILIQQFLFQILAERICKWHLKYNYWFLD